jgi:hypothetical protein
MATRAYRLAECRHILRRAGVTESVRRSLAQRVLEALNGAELSVAEIEARFATGGGDPCGRTARAEQLRAVVKHLWEVGEICYSNSALHWRCEARQFALTSQKYESLDLSSVSEDEARSRLIRQYFRSFGPATIKDAVWWSALPTGTVRRVLDESNDIVEVRERTDGNSYYLYGDDLARMRNGPEGADHWIALLAYEDPSLKGYFESRQRYVDPADRGALFNAIGEVRPCVLVDGVARGVWTWDDRSERVVLAPFKGEPAFEQAIRDEADRLTAHLRSYPTGRTTDAAPAARRREFFHDPRRTG